MQICRWANGLSREGQEGRQRGRRERGERECRRYPWGATYCCAEGTNGGLWHLHAEDCKGRQKNWVTRGVGVNLRCMKRRGHQEGGEKGKQDARFCEVCTRMRGILFWPGSGALKAAKKRGEGW